MQQSSSLNHITKHKLKTILQLCTVFMLRLSSVEAVDGVCIQKEVILMKLRKEGMALLIYRRM